MGSPGLELQRQSRQQHQLQQRCEHQQQQPPWAAAPAHRPLPAPHPGHCCLHHCQQWCDHEPGGQLVSSFNYQSKDLAFFSGVDVLKDVRDGASSVPLQNLSSWCSQEEERKISMGSLCLFYSFVCCAYTRVGLSCSKTEGSHASERPKQSKWFFTFSTAYIWALCCFPWNVWFPLLLLGMLVLSDEQGRAVVDNKWMWFSSRGSGKWLKGIILTEWCFFFSLVGTFL